MRKIILFAMFLFSVYLVSAACPDGMIAYWPGEGNASDFLGLNNGTAHSGVVYAAGQVGEAFKLNGTSWVEIPDRGSSDPLRMGLNSFSFGGWIKTNVSKGDIFGKSAGSGFYSYNIQPNGNLQICLLGTPSVQCMPSDWCVSTGVNISNNVWHQIFTTVNRSTSSVKVYVDGNLSLTQSLICGAISPTPSFYLGRYSGLYGDGPNYFTGFIDEVAVFNKTFNSAEVQQFYQNGLNGIGYCGLGEQQSVPEVGSSMTVQLFVLLIAALLIGALLLRRK